MNLSMPIPDRLMAKLTTRARNILVRDGITSCERLLEFGTADLYRLSGSGRTTVLDLEKLQSKIAGLCPGLSQCLKMYREPPVSVERQAGRIPDQLMSGIGTRTRAILVQEGITSCEALLKLVKMDLYRFNGCGHATVKELEKLQKDMVKLYPALAQYCYRPKAWFRKKKTLRAPARPASDLRPAIWSVLDRSLPELFQLSTPTFYPDCDAEPTIGSLGIPDADLERLRSISIFPEDSAHLLCCVSLGYLLSAELTDGALSLLFDASAGLCGLAGLPSAPPTTADVSDASLYQGINRDLLDSLRFPGFRYSVLLDGTDCGGFAVAWSEIAKITERRVFERLGFSPSALRAVRYLWRLAESASLIENAVLAGVPIETYRDFRQLMGVYARLATESLPASAALTADSLERARRIMEARWKSPACKRTGREIGRQEGLSHQRVWQIGTKWEAVLKEARISMHLVYLRLWLDNLLSAAGGALRVEEIAKALHEALGWMASSIEETLGGFVEIFPDYRQLCDGEIIVLSGHRCATCATCGNIRSVLYAALASVPDGELPRHEALRRLREHCKSLRCPGMDGVASFSTAFLSHLLDSNDQVYARGDVLRAKGIWLSKVGRYRRDFEQIVLSAGRKGMHFREVALLYNSLRPDKPFSAMEVHKRLTKSPSFLLWGRGTLIHRELVALPWELLTEIAADLLSRLNAEDIPYVYISGG